MPNTVLAAWHASRGAAFSGDEVASYGSPAEEARAIAEGAGLFDASARERFLVTGADRIEFVQGLCTNDLELLADGHACEAAFITPKGKLVADARIVKLEDALLFDVEAGRRAALEEQFGKYRIHEDVQWIDATELLCALELWGPKSAELLGFPALANGDGAVAEVAGAAFAAVGTPFGAVCYVPADAAEQVAGGLVEKGAKPVGRLAVDSRRIQLGIGRFGIDWDESTNPLEAGLDRALNYKKGCYVGQEVVAKATYIGHVNRRLVRLEWPGDAVNAGTTLTGGRSPGRVTSSVADPLRPGTAVGLGVVRRESAAAGSRHKVGENGPEATVLGYPFASKEKPV